MLWFQQPQLSIHKTVKLPSECCVHRILTTKCKSQPTVVAKREGHLRIK